MMGGDVTVTSEPGKGSAFTVRLPGSADVQARSSAGASDGRRSPSADSFTPLGNVGLTKVVVLMFM